MREFKDGDKVYCPLQSNKILTIRKKDNPVYPIRAGEEAFTPDGKLYIHYKTPSIFHATPENKTKLEEFYGIELEEPPAPPAPPTRREIIQAKLDIEKLPVPCWVSDVDEQPSSMNSWVFINKVVDGYSPFVDKDGYRWRFATPFNHTTLQPITELPE